METIIECLVALVVEGAMEASGSQRVPRAVRLVLKAILILFFGCVIGLVALVGIGILHEGSLGGAGFLLLAVIMAVCLLLQWKFMLRNEK